MEKDVNILIVDDSKTFNNMIKGFFEELGYTIYQAFNLKQTTEFLEKFKIDYIFLDLNLPDGDSVDMINTFQEKYHAKIIIMTGNEDPTQRDIIFEKGIVDYFIKTTPIPVIVNCANTLIETIERYKNTNILTIDDSNFVRKILKNILKSKDYNVFEASNAKDGKDIIKNNDIHLILLDLIMPEIDGMSFLEDLKSDKKYYDIPVIVVSGDYSREHYSRVLKQGASDFIKKPFIVEEVLLKCDVHLKAYLHHKKALEKEQKISKQKTMITLQQKEIEKQKSLSTLIKNLSHHWRQPLSIISTNASGVQLDLMCNQLDKTTTIERMDDVIEYTKYLSKTLDDFDMLIIKDIEKVETSMPKLIEEILAINDSFIKEKDIEVVKNIEDISIQTYSQELNKIILSIFDNIKEHAKETKHIEIDIKQNNNKITISIKDDGGGIKEDILENIFEPYFTTSHQSMGKGVGLYFIYHLIKEHFLGEIVAKNSLYLYKGKEYKGFELIIKLPI